MKKMNLKTAYKELSDTHRIIAPGLASRIAAAFLPEEDADVSEITQVYHPSVMHPGCAGMPAVGVMELARHIAKRLGVIENAEVYLGRGYQCREYVRVIREKVGR